MLRVAACLVVLASVALAGCSGGTPEPITGAQLSKSAKSSAEATSGRFAVALEVELLGQPFTMTGEGAFDETEKRSQLALDLTSFAKLAGLTGLGSEANATDFDPSEWKIDAVQDGDVMYFRFPPSAEELPAGKSWVRMDVREGAIGHGFDLSTYQQASHDRRTLLDFLRATSGEIEAVGTEKLHGVTTAHYSATVDLVEYYELVAASERGWVTTALGVLPDMARQYKEMPVDVWLDEQGGVRQLVASFSETVDVSMTFELYDYDEAVDIALPPAEDVVDAADLE